LVQSAPSALGESPGRCSPALRPFTKESPFFLPKSSHKPKYRVAPIPSLRPALAVWCTVLRRFLTPRVYRARVARPPAAQTHLPLGSPSKIWKALRHPWGTERQHFFALHTAHWAPGVLVYQPTDTHRPGLGPLVTGGPPRSV
jgi:hypothetical protein